MGANKQNRSGNGGENVRMKMEERDGDGDEPARKRENGMEDREEPVVILTTWKVCAQSETQVHVHLLLLNAI